MKNKGFTLIELLAVIIILGILMLIAIPSVTGYINNSRKNGYVESVRKVVNGAVPRINSGDFEIDDIDTTYYIHVKNIDLENGNLKSPYGDIDDAYIVITYDGDGYDYYYVGKDTSNKGISSLTLLDQIDTDDISDVDSIETSIGVGSRSKIIIYDENGNKTSVDKTSSVPEAGNKGMSNAINDCTYNGTLTAGAEYVNGQFTYRYRQQMFESNWNTFGTNGQNDYGDGWGVVLTDKESTAPVTTKLCTSINGKPVLSMAYMFNNSKTTSIDLSSFNTINIQNMFGMFMNASNVTNLDVRALNTSNVVDTTYMFKNMTNVQKLDLSNFDTSNMQYMNNLFEGCSSLTSIDISRVDLSNVNGVYWLFNGCSNIKRIYMDNWDVSTQDKRTWGMLFGGLPNIEYISMKNWKIGTEAPQFGWTWGENSNSPVTIDVTGWDTSNTTSLCGLFGQVLGLKEVKGLDTFDMSHITNTSLMFLMNYELTTLDLSGMDFSNVTNVDGMFQSDSKLTTVYVRNQADADKLNASSNKPDGLTVTVK